MIRSLRGRFFLIRDVVILGAFLVVAFALGGSARSDILSLLILRPLAALMIGFGFLGLTAGLVRRNRSLLCMAALIILLPLLQLIPLPPGIWRSLPGRQIITEIDAAAGLGMQWRPLTLVPSGTWNAVFALLVPLAAFLVAIRLNARQRWILLPVLIGLGLTSAALGLFQVLGSPNGPLYFYHTTHNGSAVGLFANRNHQAALLACLFPMLSVYASSNISSLTQSRRRRWYGLAASTLLVPLVLITGSRAGLAAAGIGIILALILYRSPRIRDVTARTEPRYKPRMVAGGLALLAAGLATSTILLGRGEAFQRILNMDASEFRWRAWGPVLEMAAKYFPFGSGFGSFVPVYQIDQPRDLLLHTYFNQAHNDWLEIALIGGLPALILLAVACVAYLRRLIVLFRARQEHDLDARLAALGLAVIGILSAASISDYPLRTPSLACVLAIAIVWAFANRNAEEA